MSDYTVFLDLAKEVQPPDKGILSRTLFSDDRLKAVAFSFAQGEELSEHTASMPAVLHFLHGYRPSSSWKVCSRSIRGKVATTRTTNTSASWRTSEA